MVAGIIGLSIANAILYRMGGADNWNKLWRRLGCAFIQAIAIIFILKIQAPWYVHFLSIGATFGGLTTYWDFINGDDSHWLHGLGIAMGCLLYLLSGSVMIWGFAIRVIALALLMGVWSKWSRQFNAVIEELGRGALIILTLLFFLIGG